jgi:DNA repair exonuclease SbcCD ATPase subunit
MADEISEVAVELKRLREEAERQKSFAKDLKKENETLQSRNEYIVNKLKEASYVYGEAGKRLLYFINNQVNPVTERLNQMDAGQKKIMAEEKSIRELIGALDKAVKDSAQKTESRVNSLGQTISSFDTKNSTAIKASLKKMQRSDEAIDAKIAAAAAGLENRLESLKVSTDRKTSAKMSAFEKVLEGKMNMLKERSLLIGKDIEELRKLESGVSGLEGRAQETIAHLTQTKLDIGKMEQQLKGAVAGIKADVKKETDAISIDVEKKVLTFASELKAADEKNLGAIRLELNRNREDQEKAISLFETKVMSYENVLNQKMQKAESEIKKESLAFVGSAEKRLKMLEKSLEASGKSSTDFERAITAKMSSMETRQAALSGEVENLKGMKAKLADLVRQAELAQQRIDKRSAALNENIEVFRDKFEKNRIVIANELEKIDKKIDQRVRLASSELEKQNAGVMARMREEFLSDVNSIGSKSDMLSKDIDGLKAMGQDIKSLEAGIKEREEAATAMKNEVKNLRALATVVGTLQKEVAGLGRKVDDMGHSVEKVSTVTASSLETEALRISKDMGSTAAKLKADMKDMISAEKEKFAGQSADLSTRYEGVSQKVEDAAARLSGLAGEIGSTKEFSAANRRQIGELEKRMKKLSAEIVGWKKEYKMELNKLLKEIEG